MGCVSLSVCICVCLSLCVYVCVCISLCVYVKIRSHRSKGFSTWCRFRKEPTTVCVCVCVSLCVYVCVCLSLSLCVCMCVWDDHIVTYSREIPVIYSLEISPVSPHISKIILKSLI